MIRTVFEWSDVAVVAVAVAEASHLERSIYVERLGRHYRWSLIHRGGAYPLLRITARYLKVEYTKIFIGFRTLDDGSAVLWEERADQTPPERWAILTLDRPMTPAGVRAEVFRRLGDPRIGGEKPES